MCEFADVQMCKCADVQMCELKQPNLHILTFSNSHINPLVFKFSHQLLVSQTNALAPRIAASASLSSLNMSFTLF
jgi:hypothetical protein